MDNTTDKGNLPDPNNYTANYIGSTSRLLLVIAVILLISSLFKS